MASLQRRGFLQAASVASLTSGFNAASVATRIPGDP